MDSSLLEILAIILGNGALIALIGYLFQYQQQKSQTDVEARKEARDYYKAIYGHIVILVDLAKKYCESLSKGKIVATDFEQCKFSRMTSETIIENYGKAYLEFEGFYIKTMKEGMEIFVSEKLQKLLFSFWHYSLAFYDDNKLLQDKKQIINYCKIADQTTDYMDKLFGLKRGGIELSLKKEKMDVTQNLKLDYLK